MGVFMRETPARRTIRRNGFEQTGAPLHKTPNTTLHPSAPMSAVSSTFLQKLRPSAEILAELEQVEASIAEKLAKARG